MPIVTLITDFGNKDYSVAAVKGALVSTVQNSQIIDISHQIEPYNVTQAAYVLKTPIKHSPKVQFILSVLNQKKHQKTIIWLCFLMGIILLELIMVFSQ